MGKGIGVILMFFLLFFFALYIINTPGGPDIEDF